MDNLYILIFRRLCILGTELCDSVQSLPILYAHDVKVKDVPDQFDAQLCIVFHPTITLRVPYS